MNKFREVPSPRSRNHLSSPEPGGMNHEIIDVENAYIYTRIYIYIMICIYIYVYITDICIDVSNAPKPMICCFF